jgi:hypothetical protein
MPGNIELNIEKDPTFGYRFLNDEQFIDEINQLTCHEAISNLPPDIIDAFRADLGNPKISLVDSLDNFRKRFRPADTTADPPLEVIKDDVLAWINQLPPDARRDLGKIVKYAFTNKVGLVFGVIYNPKGIGVDVVTPNVRQGGSCKAPELPVMLEVGGNIMTLRDDPASPSTKWQRSGKRIVPQVPHPGAGAGVNGVALSGAPPARLQFYGGPLIGNPKVSTLFWGEEWNSHPLDTVASKLQQFYKDIVTSPLITQLGEYSVPACSIGPGQFVLSYTVVDPEPTGTAGDGQIQQMITDEIQAGNLPTADKDTLYCVYLPPGIELDPHIAEAMRGYHGDINNEVFYTVTGFPETKKPGARAVFDELTIVSSHEFCEAVTDPVSGRGWYDQAYDEIGDICANSTKILPAGKNRYKVQCEWSNRARACV